MDSTLVEHLEALRKALLRCFFATLIAFPIAYFLTPYIIEFLVKHTLPPALSNLHYFTPMEVFWTELKLAFIFSLVIAYPWNAWQIWRFLLPGLYPNEQKILGFSIILASLLFFAGVLFCVWFILPLMMAFSGSFGNMQIQPTIGLANFLNLAGWLSLAFGAMFQTPIIVLIAVKVGLISTETLKKKRPYVLIAILVLAALLTPPDITSQIALAVPTYALFEIGLFLAARIEKKNIPQ